MSHATSPTVFSEPLEPDYQSGVAEPSNCPPPLLSHRFRFGSPPSNSHPPSDPSWYHSPFPHSFFPPPRYPSYTPLPLHLPQSTSTDHQSSTIQPSRRIHQANTAATEVDSLWPTPVNGPNTSHNIEDIIPPYYLPAMSSLTQFVNGHRTASTRYPVTTTATYEGPGTGSSGVFHHPIASSAASSSDAVEQHQRSAAGRGKKGSVGQVNHTRKGKKRALTPLESTQGSSGGASEACGRPEGAGTGRSLEACNPLSSKMPGGNKVEPATSCASASRPSSSTIREPRARKGASKLHSWAESDPEVVDWVPAPAIKEKKTDHDFRVPGQELRGGPSQHKSAFRYIVPFESHGAGSDATSNRRARATAFLAKFRSSPFVSPSSETAMSNQIAQSMSEVADSTNQPALSDPSSEHLGNSVSSSTDLSQSDSNSGRVSVSVRVPFGSRMRPDPSQPGSGTESSRSDRRQSKRSLRLDRRHIHSATTDAPFVLGDVPVRSKRMRIKPQPLAATRHSSSGSQGVSEPTRTQGKLETQGGQEMDRVQTAEETYTALHANQSQDVNRSGIFQEEMTNVSQQMIESQSQGRDSVNPNSSPDVTTSLSDSLHAVPLTIPTQPTTTVGGFQLVPTMSSSHAFSLSLEISGGSGGNTIDLSLDVSGMEGPSTVPPHHHNTPPALPIPSTSIPSASPSFPMLTHLPSLPSLPSLHHPAEPGTSGLGGSQEEIIIVDSSDDEDDHNVIMFTRSSPSQQYYGNRHFLRRGQRETSQIARDEEIARRLQAQFDQEMDPPHPPPRPPRPHSPPPPPYSGPALADVPRSSSETPNLPSLPPPPPPAPAPPLPPAPSLPPPRAPAPARRAVERRGSNRRSSRGSIRLPPYATGAQSYYGGSRYPNIFGLESYYGGISIPYHPNILSPEDHFRSQIYHNYPVPGSSHFPPDPHHLLHAAASLGHHSSVGRNQFNPSVVFNALLGQGANSYEDLLELADRLGPAHARGLSKEEIKALPLRKYKKDGDDKSCVVCMSEFQTKEKIRSLPPCDHDFHQKCIDKWLKDHNTCPICRVTIAVVTPSTT